MHAVNVTDLHYWGKSFFCRGTDKRTSEELKTLSMHKEFIPCNHTSLRYLIFINCEKCKYFCLNHSEDEVVSFFIIL